MRKFIQLHTLTGYSGALINRDEAGLAKRIVNGGVQRTRISSQCIKRAWRMYDGPGSLRELADAESDLRTKILIEELCDELVAEGISDNVTEAVKPEFVRAVYGPKAWKEKKASDDGDNPLDARQPLLFSGAEHRFLKQKLLEACKSDDPEKFAKDFKANYSKTMEAMRSQCDVPGGLTASLFGRMVTSDIEANIEASIHVSHSFTVHPDQTESDFFGVVDDLQKRGAGHLGDQDVGSGLYYGFVSVDRDLLVSNLNGNEELAAEVVRRLIKIATTVSPAAKKGSTAAYGYAQTAFVECKDDQPLSFATAFDDPVKYATNARTAERLVEIIDAYDGSYPPDAERAWLCIDKSITLPGEKMNMPQLCDFAAKAVASE